MLQSKEIQWMNEKTRTIYMMLTRDSHQFYRNKLKVGGWTKVSSVQFRHSVIANSLWPHRLQHTRLYITCTSPCTSPTPGGWWNSCPLIQWCHPTISSSVVHFCWLQLFLASRSFPWVSYLIIRWPKHCSFSFSISPSTEYSRLISFRIVWFDLLAVQGTLKNLLQQHNSKASILQCSAFLMVQWSNPYMTSGKTKTLTIWTFVGKVISLLLNTLSRFVITFLPRSRCLLISWLQSLSTVMLEPKKRKSVTASNFWPSLCHEVMGPDAMILVFFSIKF